MPHEIKALLGLSTMVILGTMLLYLPFFLFFKWKRRKHKYEIRTEIRLTTLGWWLSVFSLLILFAGMAAMRYAPENFTCLNSFVTGRWTFFILVFVLTSFADAVLRRCGYPTAYRAVVLPTPEKLEP